MNELAHILGSALSPRDRILALQAELAKLPSVEPYITVINHWAPGQYGREFRLAARPHGDERQSLCIGKIHRHAHINVVSAGRATVYTEDGLMEVQAPMTFVSAPGAKRVVLIHEDLIWTTVHPNPTDTRDLDQLERELIAPDYEALEHETMEVLS